MRSLAGRGPVPAVGRFIVGDLTRRAGANMTRSVKLTITAYRSARQILLIGIDDEDRRRTGRVPVSACVGADRMMIPRRFIESFTTL